MNNYRKYNTLLGWLCFAITAVVYIMTTEPSASLWDCSEFIATSYKLEIGHPPGAPLFMMISRFFAIFSPDPSKAALAINIMSCLASAMTITFLFWSITHLARKLYKKSESELAGGELWAVMGAGLIGALAYAFTDTFWFSGVEGEVYALSSLFTAAVFWAMLKWENVADEPNANRWLVLIAYLMGLSIGVHLLNLLAFPALIFIYYFKKYPVTKKGVFYATLASVVIVAFVLYFIVPVTISAGAFVDRVFVNSFNFPINSGMLFYAVALFAILGFLEYYTHKKGKVLLNTIVLMVTVVVLGYSSYASVIIRSSVNPPMNSNRPEDPYGLKRLLSREQYGDRPLLRGGYFSSQASGISEKIDYYAWDGKYHPIKMASKLTFDPEFTFFFPRMHSRAGEHLEIYKSWMKKGRQIPSYGGGMVTVPTVGENLNFFFSYQLNFMYWRYFLWNFVGRQSDIQSTGSIANGQWMSGITPIDELYLGPQSNLPDEMKENKGRNRYYFLPFILGIIGIIFQLNRDKKDFTVVMWLFFMTGIAIVLYLNQGPAEVRERDYAYAGSFYAFAIWIGLGVPWVYEMFKKRVRNTKAAAAVATAICACVPVILIAENWDDHDRSHRYISRDIGANYLKSTLPNSIIMNFGDNDTFPLWYNQEVEGVRPDVRIMNMSYLGAEWYIDQMKVKANDSEAVPFSLPREKYTGTNEVIPVMPVTDRPVAIKQIMDFVKSDDPRTRNFDYGRPLDFIPAQYIAIPVNKENAVASGIVKEEDAHLMADTVILQVKSGQLERSTLMFLDLLANFDWKRPLCFTQPTALSSLSITDWLQFDGFSYRFVPIKTPYESPLRMGRIDVDYLYDNVMNKFSYGNVKDPRVYADPFVQTSFNSSQARNAFARLAKEFIARGDNEKALEILARGLEEIPFSQIKPAYGSTVPLVEAYYMAGDTTTANNIMKGVTDNLKQYVDYFMQFPDRKLDYIMSDLEEKSAYLATLMDVAIQNGQYEIADDIYNFYKQRGLAE